MEFQTVVFYLFGAIAVAAALGVILVRNPVHAALFLVLAFFSSAAASFSVSSAPRNRSAPSSSRRPSRMR